MTTKWLAMAMLTGLAATGGAWAQDAPGEAAPTPAAPSGEASE
jgi:hypothetical protein